MQINVVRQPILSGTSELLGYEMLYEDKGVGLYNQEDILAANAIEAFFTQLDNNNLTEDNLAFLPLTPNLLMRKVARMFNPENLIIEIEDGAMLHPDAARELSYLRKQGYRVAMCNFEFSPRFFALLGEAEFLKISMKRVDDSTKSAVDIAKSFHKRVIAYHVDTPELFEQAKQLGCTYFQGSAVAQALTTNMNRLDHLQSNFFQLMIAVTRDEPDIDEIETIISRDVTLAFSLIRLVNSAFFALRNRVRSVKQALVVLGLGQLKQWVYLLSFKQNGSNLDTELIKTSFLRGSFCAELSQFASRLDMARSDAYLMGMFSTLDLLLQTPLDAALGELPIAEDIIAALLRFEGPAGTLYRLVLCYESADWAGVKQAADQLGIADNVVAQKYLECVEEVNEVWNSLQKPYATMDKQDD